MIKFRGNIDILVKYRGIWYDCLDKFKYNTDIYLDNSVVAAKVFSVRV